MLERRRPNSSSTEETSPERGRSGEGETTDESEEGRHEEGERESEGEEG